MLRYECLDNLVLHFMFALQVNLSWMLRYGNSAIDGFQQTRLVIQFARVEPQQEALVGRCAGDYHQQKSGKHNSFHIYYQLVAAFKL